MGTSPRPAAVRPRPLTALAPLLAALAFVVPFLAGLIGGSVLGDATYPSPFGGNAAILRYFAHDHDAVVLQSVLQCVSAVGLLVLAAYLGVAAASAEARPGDGGRPAASRLITAGGGFAAAFQVLSALLSWVCVRDAVQSSPALVRALHDLSFATGGPGTVLGLGLMIGGTALALRAGLPRWTGPAGLALLAVAVVSPLCLVVDQAAFLLPVARFLGMAWLLLVAYRLGRTRRGASGPGR